MILRISPIFIFLAKPSISLENASETKFWQPFDLLYSDGLNSYNKQDWQGVITNMYASIESHNQYIEKVHSCNLQCKVNNVGRKIDLTRPYGTELIPAVVLIKSKCLQERLKKW